MQRLNLEKLFKAYSSLSALRGILEREAVTHTFTESSYRQLVGIIVDLDAVLEETSLTVSLSSVREFQLLMTNAGRDAPANLFAEPVASLLSTLRHEMHTISAWRIPSEQLRFFDRTQFEESVYVRFPSTSDDIEEAGKCLGMGRNTAAAFHLMRVLEVALRRLAAALNVTITNPSWDAILDKCDREMKARRDARSPGWLRDEPFFTEAAALLRNIKFAWRNPTMHIERRYNDEEAREVWDAARAFMRHLATELSE
jgi:hypothetical protein